MPVKKDASGRRWIAVEAEVPGTPEQVWKAIATGPGISAWFVPSTVEERDGGLATANFGPGMDSTARITHWDPPRRVVMDSNDMGTVPDAPTVASEWTVEAKSGGTCVVRVVHSLFADGENWDDQLHGWESGWPSFFRILRLYLQHVPGQPSSAMALMGFGVGTSGPNRDLLVRRAATSQFGKTAFGRIYGFVYSGLDVGLALSPLVFGPVLDAGKFQAALAAVAMLQVAALLTAMRIGAAARGRAVAA